MQSPFYLETIHCIIFRSWMVCAEGTTNFLIPVRPEEIAHALNSYWMIRHASAN